MVTQEIYESLQSEFLHFWSYIPHNRIRSQFGEITILEDSEFQERNPINGVEVWRKNNTTIILSSLCLIERDTDCTNITFHRSASHSYIYGVLRSEITNVLREILSEVSLCSIHAACVKKDKKTFLIIGNKGTGKSSSSIYLHKSGGEILTDELIFFDNKGFLICLPRFVGVDNNTLHSYFPDYEDEANIEIRNMYNADKKILLDIISSSPKQSYQSIDEVIVLVRGNRKYLSPRDIINLISAQWINYKNESLTEDILKEVIKKSKPMTIEQIGKGKLL